MIETSTSAPRILIDILITVPTLWVHISVVEVGSDWVLMYMCSCQGIHSHYNNTYARTSYDYYDIAFVGRNLKHTA